MREQKQQDSKHASIHDVIDDNNNKLRKKQINQLFKSPQLSQFDTSQFQQHTYMISNDIFTFFVHELQKWNKKIRNKQITPFYNSELNRNQFVYSSLKIVCLKKPDQVQRHLEELTKWYEKNSYNTPQPCVLMKKYSSNQEWQVRKTFRSNTPSEINNYRRRFLCGHDTDQNSNFTESIFGLQKKKQNCFFQSKTNPVKSHKNYKRTNNNPMSFSQQQGEVAFRQVPKHKDKTLTRSNNHEIRMSRQEQQVKSVQKNWKNSYTRFGEKTCQDFYKGKFYHNKQLSISASGIGQRNVKTADTNNRYSQRSTNLLNQIKKDRLRTSLGVRKNFTQEQPSLNAGQKHYSSLKTQNNEQTKQNQNKWIDNFIVDQQKISLRNATFDFNTTGMRLISNPFDSGKKSKIKRKKK